MSPRAFDAAAHRPPSPHTVKKRPVRVSQPVWDRFVRLFHWSLVLAVLCNYFLTEGGKDVHQWVGYTAVTLVVARIVWGFIGSKHARFSDFVPTPARLLEQFRAWKSGVPVHYVGHNPIGSVMMLALLAMVLAMGITGWMQTLDAYWGEEWLQDIHQTLANLMIGMAALHATAAIVMGRVGARQGSCRLIHAANC